MFFPSLRIVNDVLTYRLSKLELGQFFLTIGIMFALGNPFFDFVIRSIFALLLNVFAYLNHDYLDVIRDLRTSREPQRAEYLYTHQREALVVQIALILLMLVIVFFYSIELLVPLLSGGSLCWLYSKWLKEIPYADIPTMGLWCTAMTLVAFPLENVLGWLLVIEVGLIGAVSQTLQVLRDYESDREASINTTAVRIGPEATLRLARSLMVLSALYGVLFLHKILGVFLLLPPFIPFRSINDSLFMTINRLTFAVIFGTILLWVFLSGTTAGLLVPHSWAV